MRARLSAAALALLLAAAAAGQSPPPGPRALHRVSPPGAGWSLELPLPANFRVIQDETAKDGRTYLFSALMMPEGGKPRGVTMLTVRVAPADAGADVRESAVRELRKSGLARGVKTLDYGRFKVATYSLASEQPGGGALPVAIGPSARGMEAYLVRDAHWIALKFVSAPLRDEEQAWFYTLLDAVSVKALSAAPDSLDFYQRGRALYWGRKYREAAAALDLALALEGERRRLETGQWRHLVELAIDAHGAAGDAARAKEVMDYGVANDPAHMLFHLATARYHARRGDLDGAIASLERVYLSRSRPGEFIPDPLADAAFEPFRKDKRFREAVKAMKKLK